MSSMISHERRLLFVHVPKTGGSSITYTLRDIFEFISDYTHESIWDLCEAHSDYFKFCTVRNPWDMCVSWMTWHEKHGTRKTMDEAVRKVETPLSFGLRQMSYVLRFENLRKDFAELCRRIEVQPRELLHLNDSPHTHYRDYYTPKTRQIVYERFWYTIRRFGYQF